MPFVNASSQSLVSGGDKLPHAIYSGKVRVALSEFTFATDATGTYTIPEMQFTPGQRILEVGFNTSVTLGTAQIALGIAGTVGKYRAAAVLTSADQWVFAALNAAIGVPLAAAEQWILTTSVATLPASGRLLIRTLYVDNS